MTHPPGDQMLNAVLAASPDAILVITPDGRIEFANRRVQDVFGHAPHEVVGRSLREYLTDEGDRLLFPAVGEVRLRGGDSTDQLRLDVRHREGRVVTVDIRIGEIATDDGGYVAVIRDVTEQARLERELVRAEEAADAANQAKSDYLSRMSHELRTPMNAVLGFSQMLQTSELAPGDRENVERIIRAGRHLLGLIDDVLDIARIEAGDMQISLEPVATGVVVRGAVEIVQRQAEARGISLRLLGDPVTWPHVHADRQRLSQVMINLLSNAVKYNRAGGTVEVGCRQLPDGRHRVAVADTGYGIGAEDLDRVFAPFDRLGANGGQVTGTGLGLALSRHLTEAMGGSIGCESTSGEGSTFWVDLVGASTPPEAEPRDPAAPTVEEPPPLAGTVLYIEDDPMNAELMRRVFDASPQLELVHAASGQDGIELAAERRPDLVLLDLHLAGTSGREVLRRLRADDVTRGLPVVVISADATTTSTAELLAAGADGYVTKPFDLAELRATVARMLVEGRGGGAGSSADPVDTQQPEVR